MRRFTAGARGRSGRGAVAPLGGDGAGQGGGGAAGLGQESLLLQRPRSLRFLLPRSWCLLLVLW